MNHGRYVLGVALVVLGCGGSAGRSRTEPRAATRDAPEISTPARSVEPTRESSPAHQAPALAPADPFEGTDWDAVARAADAYEDRGQPREHPGGGYERLLAPVTLPPPAACAAPPPRGIPRIHVRPTTVGPSPRFPYLLVSRVLRRTPAFAACADGCEASTDVFELVVEGDGSVARVTHRAGIGGSDERTACLTRALEGITLPEPRVAPFSVIVPVRLRPALRSSRP